MWSRTYMQNLHLAGQPGRSIRPRVQHVPGVQSRSRGRRQARVQGSEPPLKFVVSP